MSFVRQGGPPKKRKGRLRKATWDDSVTDLSVHKATPEEIQQRKESHKSKHHLSVKLEKIRKEKERNLTGVEAKQLAIIKEVLYNQQQFEDAVAKSDSMVAVVKDLFGDDPKRFMGFPNVTTAPDSKDNQYNSLVMNIPEIYTDTERLSDSVMHQFALNDVQLTDSEDEDGEIERPEPISYKPKMNLERFQQFVQEEESRNPQPIPETWVNKIKDGRHGVQRSNVTANNSVHSELAFLAQQISQGKGDGGDSQPIPNPQLVNMLLCAMAGSSERPLSNFKTPPKNEERQLPSDRTPPSAINDTKKVKKTKRAANSPRPNESAADNGRLTMGDMKKVLQDLESEMENFENQTGRRRDREPERTDTFSGYTVALVNAVSRLTRYLKETEQQVKTEVTLREQLTEDVFQLRTIIDALAADLINTQEEYGKLFSEYRRYKESTEKELEVVHKQLTEIKNLIVGNPVQSSVLNTHSKNQQKMNTSAGETHVSRSSRTSTPVMPDTSTLSASGEYQRLPVQSKSGDQSLVSVSSAVMLSPPVQKSRFQDPRKKGQSQLLVSATDKTRASTDPPILTQAPPVTNKVNVPRPIPLVQSNVPLALTPDTAVTSTSGPVQENNVDDPIPTSSQQENDVDELLNNPELQTLMQTQIAELSRQQEEARKRLRDLLENQRFQQKLLQDQLGPEAFLDDEPILTDQAQVLHKQQTMHIVSPPISPISQQSEQELVTAVSVLKYVS